MTMVATNTAYASDAPVLWQPNSQAQIRFLASPAYEALYGGAAGGGKTDALMMNALRWVHIPTYRALGLRREYKDLMGSEGLWERAEQYYKPLGAIPNLKDSVWKFPSGAKIFFGHMNQEKDKYSYQGLEYDHIFFDELAHFSKSQYLYLFTRVGRKSHAVVPSIRAGSNPGTEWVKERFIDPMIFNKPKFFLADDKGRDIEVTADTPDAFSRAFYPATVYDNPAVKASYISNLKNIADPVLRAQLLYGDWNASYSDRLVYPNFFIGDGGNVEDVKYNPNLPLIWGVDDGFAVGSGKGSSSYHPRVILIGQVTPQGGLNILDEYVVAGVTDYSLTIDEMVNRLNPDTGKPYGRPYVAYVDSSAAMFKAVLISHRNQIRVVGSTHRIWDGVRNVRRLIGGDDFPRLLKVHSRCRELIWEMSHYEMDLDHKSVSGEPTPFKLNDHTQDALRYMAWHLRYNQ